MLTTGRKNRLFRVRVFHVPRWVGKVSAKSKLLPTSSEVPGIPTRKIRCGGWELTLITATALLCRDSAESAGDTMSLPQLSSRSSFSSLTIRGENKLNRPNILEEIHRDCSFWQHGGLLYRSLRNSHFALVVCKNQYKLHFLHVSRYRLNVFSCHWWGTAGAAMLHCCTWLLLLNGILHILLRVLSPQPNNYNYDCCSVLCCLTAGLILWDCVHNLFFSPTNFSIWLRAHWEHWERG